MTDDCDTNSLLAPSDSDWWVSVSFMYIKVSGLHSGFRCQHIRIPTQHSEQRHGHKRGPGQTYCCQWASVVVTSPCRCVFHMSHNLFVPTRSKWQ
jgi:hypothetical protein